ncbi:MAG: hypothetical protein ACRDP6_39075 [Actinoallomurus sp.]
MSLDLARVNAAIDFLTSYAEATLSQLERSQPPSEPLTPDDPAWILRLDAASALREAGQWAVCVDPLRGLGLLDRAGSLYYDAGLGFGFFLRVLAGPWFQEPPFESFARGIQTLTGPGLSSPDVGPGAAQSASPLEESLRHPQQQAYFLLAATGSPVIAMEFGRDLSRLLTESPHSRGVAPVGALGTPIHRLWAVARALLTGTLGRYQRGDEEEQDSPVRTVTEHLIAMSRDYAESIELAMVNDHCWRNAASPVDVGDVDIIGIVGYASRIFGFDTVYSTLIETTSNEHQFARLLIEMALDAAGRPRAKGES